MNGDEPTAEDPRSAPRRSGALGAVSLSQFRRRPWMSAGLLLVLFLLVVLVPRDAERSRTLPHGHWGAAIACLEHDGQVRVTDTRTGVVPTRATTEVTVTRTIGDLQLARMADAGTSAAAAAAVSAGRLVDAPRALYHTAGSIVWAFEENGTPLSVSANAGDRAIIGYCATHG